MNEKKYTINDPETTKAAKKRWGIFVYNLFIYCSAGKLFARSIKSLNFLCLLSFIHQYQIISVSFCLYSSIPNLKYASQTLVLFQGHFRPFRMKLLTKQNPRQRKNIRADLSLR